MVILDEHVPCFYGLLMPIALACSTINDRRAVLALSVRIGASIEGVLENRDDVAISDRSPLERRQCLAVRRVGKVDVLGGHPQQDLPGAAELPELLEDEPDHLL